MILSREPRSKTAACESTKWEASSLKADVGRISLVQYPSPARELSCIGGLHPVARDCVRIGRKIESRKFPSNPHHSMKHTSLFLRYIAFVVCFSLLQGCTTLQRWQSSPGVQAAETAAISIGFQLGTGSPAFSWVAPLAVSGLTALAGNKKAVTGVPAVDVPLIVSTVKAAIPNSAGAQAATSIAQAYQTGMQGQPQTPSVANQVIQAIASGLNNGAVTASNP